MICRSGGRRGKWLDCIKARSSIRRDGRGHKKREVVKHKGCDAWDAFTFTRDTSRQPRPDRRGAAASIWFLVCNWEWHSTAARRDMHGDPATDCQMRRSGALALPKWIMGGLELELGRGEGVKGNTSLHPRTTGINPNSVRPELHPLMVPIPRSQDLK